MTRSVRQFYSGYVEKEWTRFLKDQYHRLEFDTTLEFLRRYLPKEGLILDAGGGLGRYTVELAKRGCDVILLDYTPANLRFAEKQIESEGVGKRVKGVVEGTIVNLARFSGGSFDAVLCLGGPLSHVMLERDRRRAITELVRVARKGSPIFISVISRLRLGN